MKNIEIIEPVFKAWDRMKIILFEPFDFVKWLCMGFCAWLAYLGEPLVGGGNNYSFNWSGGFPKTTPTTPGTPPQMPGVKDFLPDWVMAMKDMDSTKLAIIITSIIIGLIIIIGTIGLLNMWLKARGEFMFLECIVNDTGEVVAPWKANRQAGNSVFLWRLGFIVITVGISLIFIIPVILLLYPWVMACINAKEIIFSSTPFIALGIVIILGIISSIWHLIPVLFRHFAIPIMYIKNIRSMEACRIFWSIFKSAWTSFILYLLIYWLLNIAVGIALMILCVMTCFIGFFFVGVIPFIWAVTTLPLLVFFRLYHLEFLRQFGEEFDLLANQEF